MTHGRELISMADYYEIHIGTFTKQGTWKAATEQLKGLANLE